MESAKPEPSLIFGFMLSYFPKKHKPYPYHFFKNFFDSLSPSQLVAILYKMSEPPASRYLRYYVQRPLSQYLKEKKHIQEQLSDSELCKLIFLYQHESLVRPKYVNEIILSFLIRDRFPSCQLKDLALLTKVPDYTHFNRMGEEAIRTILIADDFQLKKVSPDDVAVMIEGAAIQFKKTFAKELLVRIAEIILAKSGFQGTRLFSFFAGTSFPTLSRMANSFNQCSKGDNERLNALAKKVLEVISIEVCSYPDLHQWRSPYMSLAASAFSDHPDNPMMFQALKKITDHVAQFPPLGANGQTLFLLARGINQQADNKNYY